MAVMLVTLIVLLFAALPTWPYSASGRARYRRSQTSWTLSWFCFCLVCWSPRSRCGPTGSALRLGKACSFAAAVSTGSLAHHGVTAPQVVLR